MNYIVIYIFVINIGSLICANHQSGPDPWDYDNEISSKIKDDFNVPPDLRYTYKRKEITDSNISMNDRFFKRLLAILLKFGQVQREGDKVDISLQMRFDENQWQLLNDYATSNNAFSDEMYRRTLGYLEDAIYKPSVVRQMVITWSEYIYFYLVEYKVHITWAFGFLGGVCVLLWLWNHTSHKHLIISIFIMLYLYEVFISYKEAEQKELERFLSAMNSCKWKFWSSECDLPHPDPLMFLKHMNPLKIAMRMFTTLISEPMIGISETMQVMIHGVTDGLWFPFNKIAYGFLIVMFNILLIFILIMTVFNYLFNIPFQMNLVGLFNFSVKQRKRTLLSDNNNSDDRISGATLHKLLDVCSKAITSQRCDIITNETTNRTLGLRRSASAGRLSHVSSVPYSIEEQGSISNRDVKRRTFLRTIGKNNGSGDA